MGGRRGELLKNAPKAQGRRSDLVAKSDQVPTLKEQGVDKRAFWANPAKTVAEDRRHWTFGDNLVLGYPRCGGLNSYSEIRHQRKSGITITDPVRFLTLSRLRE